MPPPTDQSMTDVSSSVRVFIPAALKRPSHTLYCVCVKVDETPEAPASEWTVNRRYSQFLEMREKVVRYLERGGGCPGCANTALAIASFPFPGKAWFRTNKLVRQRVRDLQTFIQVVIGRAYSTKPKCVKCGAGLQNIVQPFFSRGAQAVPRHSIIAPEHSTYGRRDKGRDASDCSTVHSGKDLDVEFVRAGTASSSASSCDGMSSTRSLRVSVSLSDHKTLHQAKCTFVKDPRAPATIDETTSYLDGATKCTDARPSVVDALKDVVIADGFANTKQEKMYRLSTMWESFELEDIQREMASTNRFTKTGFMI